MLVIEFLGAPYSGKSYYKNKIEKDIFFNNFQIYDFRKNFFCNLKYIQKLNIFQKYILNLYCIRSVTDIKKKNKLVNKKKNFIVGFIQNEINNLIKLNSDSFKNKNLEFAQLINNNLVNSKETEERIENLNRWINELFASYEILSLIKSNKKIIIDSEGFIHRLNSFIISSNDKSFIKSYIKVCPKPNILIYVKEDFKIINERIKNTKVDIDKYKYTLKNICNNSQIIYEEIKKYPTKVFVLNSKNFADVKNKVIKYIKYYNL
jgi:hypothetical protein